MRKPTPDPEELEAAALMKTAVASFVSAKRGERFERAIDTMRRESITDVYDAIAGTQVVRFMRVLRSLPDDDVGRQDLSHRWPGS